MRRCSRPKSEEAAVGETEPHESTYKGWESFVELLNRSYNCFRKNWE